MIKLIRNLYKRFKISFRIEAKSSEIQDRIRERERYRLNFAFLLSRANSIDSCLSSVHFIAVIFRAEPAPFRMSMSRFFWSVSPNQLYFTLRHRCLWYDLTSSVSFFLPFPSSLFWRETISRERSRLLPILQSCHWRDAFDLLVLVSFVSNTFLSFPLQPTIWNFNHSSIYMYICN